MSTFVTPLVELMTYDYNDPIPEQASRKRKWLMLLCHHLLSTAG